MNSFKKGDRVRIIVDDAVDPKTNANLLNCGGVVYNVRGAAVSVDVDHADCCFVGTADEIVLA